MTCQYCGREFHEERLLVKCAACADCRARATRSAVEAQERRRLRGEVEPNMDHEHYPYERR